MRFSVAAALLAAGQALASPYEGHSIEARHSKIAPKILIISLVCMRARCTCRATCRATWLTAL